MKSVFSEGNTVLLCFTSTTVGTNTILFHPAKEDQWASLKKSKPNLSLNLLFCYAATKKGGTDQMLVCQS